MTFDDELGVALRELTAPRSAPLDARARVAVRMVARRRRIRAVLGGALAAVIVPTGGVLAAHLQRDRGEVIVADGTPVKANDLIVTDYGVSLSIRLTFAENRQITGGRVLVDGGRSDDSCFTLVNGEDLDYCPDPLAVPAGTQVLVEDGLQPDCRVPVTETPVFEVDSQRSDGEKRVDRYALDDPVAWKAAVEQWCAKGPIVLISQSSVKPHGDFMVMLTVANPGVEPITVASAAYEGDGISWAAAQVVVDPGKSGTLTLRGQGNGCSADTPWVHDLLTADGVPITLADENVGMCG